MPRGGGINHMLMYDILVSGRENLTSFGVAVLSSCVMDSWCLKIRIVFAIQDDN